MTVSTNIFGTGPVIAAIQFMRKAVSQTTLEELKQRGERARANAGHAMRKLEEAVREAQQLRHMIERAQHPPNRREW